MGLEGSWPWTLGGGEGKKTKEEERQKGLLGPSGGEKPRRTGDKLALALGPSSCLRSAFHEVSEPVCTSGWCQHKGKAANGVICSFSDFPYRPVLHKKNIIQAT